MLKALGSFLIVKPIYDEKGEIECWEVLSVGCSINNIVIGDIVYAYDFGIEEIVFEENPVYVLEIRRVYAKK